MEDTDNTPPRNIKRKLTQAFYRDKRNQRLGEAIGGGYIVAKRGRDSGRVRLPQWPFEHPTRELAEREARRLAESTPGARFVVLRQEPDFVAVHYEDSPKDDDA